MNPQTLNTLDRQLLSCSCMLEIILCGKISHVNIFVENIHTYVMVFAGLRYNLLIAAERGVDSGAGVIMRIEEIIDAKKYRTFNPVSFHFPTQQ